MKKSLYMGNSFVHNGHLLVYAAECVRNWGQLSRYSAFTFENYNGVLLGYFHGTQRIPIQINSHILEVLHAPMRKLELQNISASNFFQDKIENKQKSKYARTIENVVL